MSHKYHMRIELRNVNPSSDNIVLDEIVPKWWNGEYGRQNDVLWIEGDDRMVGITEPESFQKDLAARIKDLLGYFVAVRIHATDTEGADEGRTIEIGV